MPEVDAATARQVLIIHGWSDQSKSFRVLGQFLAQHGYAVSNLWLADYISLDDDVRVADVARRMGEVIADRMKANLLAPSFDVIVHSTGGLVAREWLVSHYQGRAEQCPMKRLIMLAPANFGSKLAAMGKSFLGRVVKGYNNWFHTGKAILDDLELASSYQSQLVQRDLLIGPDSPDQQTPTAYYRAEAVWPFVIIGTHPYTSLFHQIVNEYGADGTVRACAANMNVRGMSVDFRQDRVDQAMQVWPSRLSTPVPFAVLATRTHASITDPERIDPSHQESIAETPEQQAQLGRLILQALHCQDFAAYQNIAQEWLSMTEAIAPQNDGEQQSSASEEDDHPMLHQYLQINCSVRDDQGKPVDDYFLEFFTDTSKRHTESNVYMHGSVLENVKTNSQDAASRNLYFDYTDLMRHYYQNLPKNTEQVLHMSISAASPGPNINYFEREKVGAEMEVPLHVMGDAASCWLQKNTTHFLQMTIPRIPNNNVFTIKRLTE